MSAVHQAVGIRAADAGSLGNFLAVGSGDEYRNIGQAVAVQDMCDSLLGIRKLLLLNRHGREAAGQLVADPVGLDAAPHRASRFGVPLEAVDAVGRLQRTELDVRIEVDVGKLDLLDRLAALADELGFQRKAGFQVEPDAVPVPVAVVGPNGEDQGLAAGNPVASDDGDVIFVAEPNVARRQGRKQGALVVPLLDEHRFPVGQDAVHFVAVADDLQAVALLDDDLFVDDAVSDRMHDLERFGDTVLEPNDGALVVDGLHGIRHSIQPSVWIPVVGECGRNAENACQCDTGRCRAKLAELHGQGCVADSLSAASESSSASRSTMTSSRSCTETSRALIPLAPSSDDVSP